MGNAAAEQLLPVPLQCWSQLAARGVGSRELPPVLGRRILGMHEHGAGDAHETMCALSGGISVLSGTRPVVPALPHGCCFREGTRRRPGRARA